MPHMKWPPQIKDINVYGEVKDVSGCHVTRDIGRPVYLGGHTYYVFGDTFFHNEVRQFIGASNNTVALVPDPGRHPTKCQYLIDQPCQPTFIPRTPSEEAYDNEPHNKQVNNRVVNWSFGGIIEDAPGSSEGWVFYEKMLTHGADSGKYFGMGIARVAVQHDRTLRVNRLMGDDLVFGENEPHFGTVTHKLEDDGYVYLLGPKDAPSPTLDLKNHWARIQRNADFTRHENYEFLHSDGQWSRQYELHQLMNIMPAQAQGAIIKEPLLAPQDRPYLWFGVNKFGGNVIYMACAPSLSGPWEEWEGPEIPRYGGGGLRYCLYPHHKSCKPAQGEMLISWSDAGNTIGGIVVQAMLKFVMEGEDAKPPPAFGSAQQSFADKGREFLKRFKQ